MKTYENHRKSMKSMKIYEKTIEIHENQWKSIKIHEIHETYGNL